MIAAVDEPSEVEEAEAWLSANKDALTYVNDQDGCGCCVRIWRLEGPAAVLTTIPPTVLAASSEWDSA
jgi:hypothetical protein